MPVCRSTFGALTRSRASVTSITSTSKTLVPFLYQTATIQGAKPNSRPTIGRNLSSKSRRDEHVPFEGEELLPPTIDDAAAARRTTMTGPERSAFEKLYKKSNAQRPHDGLPFNHELDQIADEWYEEDEDSDSNQSLDTVFDAVLAGLSNKRAPTTNRAPRNGRFRDASGDPAQDMLQPEVSEAKKRDMAKAQAATAQLQQQQRNLREHVQQLLQGANTDKELWLVLEKNVFDPIRALDLDGQKTSAQTADDPQSARSEPTSSGSQSAETSIELDEASKPLAQSADKPWLPAKRQHHFSDTRILFPTFPNHLVDGVLELRAKFPSSTLPFAIIPTLKSLGRSSYAIGATTQLYNLLIKAAWYKTGNYDYIDELLTDMENGGIEFDAKTLSLLEMILNEHADGKRGHFGYVLQTMYRMQHVRNGAEKLRSWKQVVSQRLGLWSEQRAKANRMIRKYEYGNDAGPRMSHVEPRDSITPGARGHQTRRTPRDGQQRKGVPQRQPRPRSAPGMRWNEVAVKTTPDHDSVGLTVDDAHVASSTYGKSSTIPAISNEAPAATTTNDGEKSV